MICKHEMPFQIIHKHILVIRLINTRFTNAHSMFLQQAFESKCCRNEATDNYFLEKSKPITCKIEVQKRKKERKPDINFFHNFIMLQAKLKLQCWDAASQ